MAALLRARIAWRGDGGPRRPQPLPDPRDPRTPFRARGFLLRDARARHRGDLAFRDRRAEIPLSARGRRRRADRGVRAERARERLGRRRDDDDGDGGRRRLRARRREDADLERRHRFAIRGVRPHRRGRGREGDFCLRGGRGHAGAQRAGTLPRHGAPPARHRPLRGLPRLRDADASRARRRVQGGDGLARRVPLDRRRRRTRFRPPRPRRGAGAQPEPDRLRQADRRDPADPGKDRRHGGENRRGRPAHLPLGMDQGHLQGPGNARGGDRQALRHRGRAGGHRPGGPGLRRPRG